MPAPRRSRPAGEMIRRSLLSYQRAAGGEADRAGVKFLTATGQSAKGMYETFKRFADEILFAAHAPIPICSRTRCRAERVAALEELAKTSPYWDKKDRSGAAAAPRHDARQALGLPRAAGHGRAALSADRHQPAGALCARDLDLPHGDLRSALAQIDGLIQAQPNNPYFYELKGQALLEGGSPAEAIAPLRARRSCAHNRRSSGCCLARR